MTSVEFIFQYTCKSAVPSGNGALTHLILGYLIQGAMNSAKPQAMLVAE